MTDVIAVAIDERTLELAQQQYVEVRLYPQANGTFAFTTATPLSAPPSARGPQPTTTGDDFRVRELPYVKYGGVCVCCQQRIERGTRGAWWIPALKSKGLACLAHEHDLILEVADRARRNSGVAA